MPGEAQILAEGPSQVDAVDQRRVTGLDRLIATDTQGEKGQGVGLKAQRSLPVVRNKLTASTLSQIRGISNPSFSVGRLGCPGEPTFVPLR